MALRIETFSNVKGGNAFFKAVGHPLAIAPARTLLERLASRGPVAIYDPLGLAECMVADVLFSLRAHLRGDLGCGHRAQC